MNITVTGILSYPNLHRAVALENFPNNPPMFRCTVLLKKGSMDLSRVESLVERLKHDRWGNDIPSPFDLRCLIYTTKDPATQGYVAFKALSHQDDKPYVGDVDEKDIIVPSQCVPGHMCQMSASVYAYDKSGNGVSASINGVQISDVMGELGALGRDKLSVQEMFGGNRLESKASFVKPTAVKKYIMTDEAKKLNWNVRSDVKGGWDKDELLLTHGYMIEDVSTVRSEWY